MEERVEGGTRLFNWMKPEEGPTNLSLGWLQELLGLSLYLLSLCFQFILSQFRMLQRDLRRMQILPDCPSAHISHKPNNSFWRESRFHGLALKWPQSALGLHLSSVSPVLGSHHTTLLSISHHFHLCWAQNTLTSLSHMLSLSEYLMPYSNIILPQSPPQAR